ncbi:MAG: D-alanyl-D-alanine carboxypeptidase [Clostridia bacterium]|nr:D-alanyl-D-alanine carboxypeptidase [Clostridia bacterium]
MSDSRCKVWTGAKRALIFALALFAALNLFIKPVSAFDIKEIRGEKLPKPFKPVQVEQTEPPVQRSDLCADELECMASAKAAVLIEASSGQMLLKKEPDLRLPMASTTKTMTALVTIENCSLDDVVVVSKQVVGVEGSSLYLTLGERLTVRDLLYGLMLSSGNDAAVALAIHVGGSVEGFADMMNERAAKLGLENTHFVTPNGLHDDEHYTSAYDLAVIGAAALKYDVFHEIVSCKYYKLITDRRTVTIKNKNTMLWDYEGCIGIKTGYTKRAGRCLLFAAERDGMTLVGVVLKCSPMFEVAPEMLDFGFENYMLVRAVNSGMELSRGFVQNGDKSFIPLVAKEDVAVPMRKGDELKAEIRTNISGAVYAPIVKGAVLGEAEILIGGCVVGKTELVAGDSVFIRAFPAYFKYLIRLFSGGH